MIHRDPGLHGRWVITRHDRRTVIPDVPNGDPAITVAHRAIDMLAAEIDVLREELRKLKGGGS